MNELDQANTKLQRRTRHLVAATKRGWGAKSAQKGVVRALAKVRLAERALALRTGAAPAKGYARAEIEQENQSYLACCAAAAL